MKEQGQTATQKAWDAIEQEKRRDRWIVRVATIAWTIVILLAAVYTTVTVVSVVQLIRTIAAGGLAFTVLAGALTPLVVVLGSFALLVAMGCTAAAFFRLRTASLAEIQLRLAALENMLSSEPTKDGKTN